MVNRHDRMLFALPEADEKLRKHNESEVNTMCELVEDFAKEYAKRICKRIDLQFSS